MHVWRLKKQFGFKVNSIITMDETSVWNDMVSSATVEQTGAKEVPLKMTVHKKVKVLVYLTAKGVGTKLKPYNFRRA